MASSEHRAVFVSGASSGIGEAVAHHWLNRGYQVWGTARCRDRLTKFADQKNFHAVEFDLLDRSAALESYKEAEKSAGGFGVVVNNAGFGLFGVLTEIPARQWDEQLSAMLTNTFMLVQRQVELMVKRDRSATLVNVSSLAVDFPLPFMAGYNVAKAGLSALSESLLMELSKTPIRVIDFRPGDVRTKFNAAMQPSATVAPSAQPQKENMEAAWRTLEQNLDQGPSPESVAVDLWRAVKSGRRGTVTTGGWFQATLAPFLIRLFPQGLARSVRWRYFGIR